MRKFSDVLQEYLNRRDDLNDPNHFFSIPGRRIAEEELTELLEEMDEMFRVLDERISYTGNE